MVRSWKQAARRELIERRGDSGVWSYRAGGRPDVEPTVLACLGLLASGDEEDLATSVAFGPRASDWLTAMQCSDGSLGVSERVPSPGWSTSYGLMLWSAQTGYHESRRRACEWLLAEKGTTSPRSGGVGIKLGHDPSLVGWPWVSGTHSWLEPTALSIVALCRVGMAHHERVIAGIGVVVDRALDRGGWNCGSKSILGTELRAQPAPTGIALLSLAAGGQRSATIGRGVAYLLETLPEVRAAVSVGWGVLGLRAHNALPVEADSWLAEAHARCAGKADAAMGLALLLLASSDVALGLLVKPALAGS